MKLMNSLLNSRFLLGFVVGSVFSLSVMLANFEILFDYYKSYKRQVISFLVIGGMMLILIGFLVGGAYVVNTLSIVPNATNSTD